MLLFKINLTFNIFYSLPSFLSSSDGEIILTGEISVTGVSESAETVSEVSSSPLSQAGDFLQRKTKSHSYTSLAMHKCPNETRQILEEKFSLMLEQGLLPI